MMVKQETLDKVRLFNKRLTNKVLIHLCGRRFGHFVILGHVGRKTGTPYHIPVIAERSPEGFVIPMTYGKKTDWYANVCAAGTCTVFWKKQEFTLVEPKLIDQETALQVFPPILRKALRRSGIEFFLSLRLA
jgi:deazaflavin-dependent oxidoreductase (nitroreductase family)